MNKRNKDLILYKLNFLKSLGYEYCENVNLNINLTNTLKLPNDLLKLENIVDNCHLCSLSKSRKNILFGYGNPNADILFLYDEPNASEDLTKEYYTGKNGELLEKMITNVLKIKKEDVYITSLVKCKSSNNSITKEDINSCASYLKKQIDLINPKLLVLLGENVHKLIFNDKFKLEDNRGKFIRYNNIETLCTYHPNFLLRNPSLKKEAFHDMLKIKAVMEKF